MEIKRAEKRGTRPFWPVLGFIMLVALSAIAYLLAPSAISLARQVFPSFRGPTPLPMWQMQLAFAFVVFVVFASIGAAIVALFAPKARMRVKDSDLVKERTKMLKAREDAKRRQRRLNRKMRGG